MSRLAISCLSRLTQEVQMAYKPTDGMKEEARRGLEWRREFGRGGTAVGVARARDIVNGKELSESTVKRMHSFFSRHEVDKKAEGFRPGEDGYPSAGRIAWALWGGDAGQSWARDRVASMDNDRGYEERPYPNEHAARIRDPEKYDDFRRMNDEGGAGIDFIIGLWDGQSEIQSIRFDADEYSVSEAKDWLDRNNFTAQKFEPAIGSEERAVQTDEKDDMIPEATEGAEMSEQRAEPDELSVGEETAAPVDVDAGEEPDISTEAELNDRFSRDDMKTRSMDGSAKVIDKENRRVRIAISSEEPVERSFGAEILDHSEASIDLEFARSGRMPLLLDHDPRQQIGVVEGVELDSATRRLRGTVRFGKGVLASEIYADVMDDIRSNISVGYAVNKMDREGSDRYRVSSWSPMEVSVVSIPADRTVGVGRAAETSPAKPVTETPKMETTMTDEVKIDVEAVKAEAARAAAKETGEIYRLAAKHNKREMADEAVKNGTSLAEFRGQLLDVIGSKPLDDSAIGLSKKEVRNFSLMRAIRAMANPSDRGARAAAEFEFEAAAEAAKRDGIDPQGLYIPADVRRSWSKRDLNTSDDSAMVAEDYRGGDFIDVLRNASSVMQAGATMLTGLVGDVKIPKKTAASTAGWISTEGGASSESEPTFGQVTMSPKTLGAFTDITRLMMMQSSLDIEALVRNDLSTGLALAIDNGALQGSGSSGQPTGVKNTSGINTPTAFAAANPTFAEVVAMETAVAEDNALMGNLAYILPASMYGALKTTVKDSGSGQFVIEPGGTMNGYRAIVSNQVTAGDLYFGNFSDLLIGMYGGLDITVDPYTASTSGTVRIVALQTVDVAVRHAVSFAYNNDGV
jgi:HK97 family phage major capsid protein/HK97 family phage prohead protease